MSSANSQRRNRPRSSRLVGLLGAALLLSGTAWSAEPTVTGLDPRIELGEIAYWLHARPPRPKIITPATTKYLERLATYFAPYERHPAVSLSALYAPPRLPTPSRGFHARAGILLRDSKTDPWIKKLRHFSKEARFKKFFSDNSRLYSKQIDKLRKRLREVKHIQRLEKYTGIPFKGTSEIILAPMLEAAGTMGSGADIHIPSKDGLRIHCLLSTLLLDDLDSGELPEDIPLRIWHETGHAVLDPLGNLHMKKIESGRPKDEPLKTWAGDFKDLVTQAVTLRLFALSEGEESEARLLAYEDERDRAYLKPLLKRLKKYEKNRKKYPTLAEFYPEILTAL